MRLVTALNLVIILLTSSEAFAINNAVRETRTATRQRSGYISPNIHNVYIEGDDNREVIPRIGNGQPTDFNAVGILRNPRTRSRVSSFLVDECYVLTVYHGTFSDPRRPTQNESLDFHVGQVRPGRSGSFSDRTQATPIGWNPETPRRGLFTTVNDRTTISVNDIEVDEEFDWSVHRLDNCLGKKHGYMRMCPMSYDQASATPSMTLSGFPGDRDNRHLWGDRTMTVDGIQRNLTWKAYGDTTNGNSGGPLTVNVNGVNEVVGIASMQVEPETRRVSTNPNSARTYTSILPIELIRDDVLSAIRTDKERRGEVFNQDDYTSECQNRSPDEIRTAARTPASRRNRRSI